MSGVEEIAVGWITEVDDSALLRLVITINHSDATVTVIKAHSTDSVEGNETIGKGFGLMVPFLTCIDVV